MIAEDLRIGNWVQRIGWPLQIVGIKGTDIWVEAKGVILEYELYDGFQPIKLTEEWLVKLGFKPIMGNEFAKWVDEYEGRLIYIDSNFRFYGIEENGSILFTSGNNFNTVHQLQNLYHALTGEYL